MFKEVQKGNPAMKYDYFLGEGAAVLEEERRRTTNGKEQGERASHWEDAVALRTNLKGLRKRIGIAFSSGSFSEIISKRVS